jgi:hypothetical protein
MAPNGWPEVRLGDVAQELTVSGSGPIIGSIRPRAKSRISWARFVLEL